MPSSVRGRIRSLSQNMYRICGPSTCRCCTQRRVSHFLGRFIYRLSFIRRCSGMWFSVPRQLHLLTYHLPSYPFQKYFSFDPAQTPESSICSNKISTHYSSAMIRARQCWNWMLMASIFPETGRRGNWWLALIFLGRGRIEDGVGFYLAKANPTLCTYKGIYSFDDN